MKNGNMSRLGTNDDKIRSHAEYQRRHPELDSGSCCYNNQREMLKRVWHDKGAGQISHSEFISASLHSNKTLKQIQGDESVVFPEGWRRAAFGELFLKRQTSDNDIRRKFKEEALNKDAFRAPLRFGFTLIELLVVVLIIGILASVALPQYEKAVAKSRLVEARQMLGAIRGAIERYRLENDAEPSTFADLDLSFVDNTGTTVTETRFSTKDWSYVLIYDAYCLDDQKKAVSAGNSEMNLIACPNGSVRCMAYGNSGLCQQLGFKNEVTCGSADSCYTE